MLDRLTPPVRGLILDMDGVLWRDAEPIGDLPAIFSRIHARGLDVVLATNNATQTVAGYLDKLRGYGVMLEPRQIVTSSDATAHLLAETFPHGGAVYVVGENGILSALRERGFEVISDPEDESPVVAVVSGIDRTLSYQKLRRATLHIRAGRPFYGTNPDKTFPTPLGLVPGAGAILAALEAATGIQPIVVGKPAPYMLELAAQRMALTRDDVLVIGDRLETDVAGGQSMGARTALVLSGVSTAAEAELWSPGPVSIARDLAELVG
jgi:phosphoglycolate/pyridoxal phosphate phosphatase family enzyme